MSIEYELEVEGIEVVFATNTLPQGDDGRYDSDGLYFSAKQYSKGMAYAIRARQHGGAGDRAYGDHCKIAPYGLDFLYLIDDKPSHVTRTLSDGRQLKLHPNAMGKNPRKEQILQVFPKNPKAGKNLHYRKQPYEKVVLVPGAPEALATGVEIFMLALKAGWGGPRIAAELNDRGLPAPRGGAWVDNTVNYILRNKTYLGIGIANMKTHARVTPRATQRRRRFATSARERWPSVRGRRLKFVRARIGRRRNTQRSPACSEKNFNHWPSGLLRDRWLRKKADMSRQKFRALGIPTAITS